MVCAVRPVEVGPETHAEQAEEYSERQYAGFWVRLVAWIIDTIVVWFVTGILAFVAGLGYVGGVGGTGIVLVGPLYFVLLTGLRGQTVGKMVVGVRVIGRDGRTPGLGYAVLREIVGKFVSALVFFIGFLWIGWDRKKQGWHDKIAAPT